MIAHLLAFLRRESKRSQYTKLDGRLHDPGSRVTRARQQHMPDFVRQDLAERACFVAANLRGGGALQ